MLNPAWRHTITGENTIRLKRVISEYMLPLDMNILTDTVTYYYHMHVTKHSYCDHRSSSLPPRISISPSARMGDDNVFPLMSVEKKDAEREPVVWSQIYSCSDQSADETKNWQILSFLIRWNIWKIFINQSVFSLLSSQSFTHSSTQINAVQTSILQYWEASVQNNIH